MTATTLVIGVGLGVSSLTFSTLANCTEIGLPEFVVFIFILQYMPRILPSRRKIFIHFAPLFSISIVWLYAYILTLSGAYKDAPLETKKSCCTYPSLLIKVSPWIRVPHPFQWGTPTFEIKSVFAMVSASFVALNESTGVYIAAARYSGATPTPPSVVSRGVGWQGVGLLLNGLFGTMNGCSASSANVGLLAMTGVGSRRVVQIAAGFMIVSGVLGKIGLFFASIPLSIFAAMCCATYGCQAYASFGLLQFCNMNSSRTTFILGLSSFMGFSVPSYFNRHMATHGYYPVHTNSITFNNTMNVFFSSNATVAVIVALFLDCTLDIGNEVARRETGFNWWRKFRYFSGDRRSALYYSLPFGLSRYFPSS